MDKSNKFTIENNRCISCKVCIAVCPANIFEIQEGNININKNNIIYCLNCGDCIASCPREAIQSNTIDKGQTYDGNMKLSTELLLRFLKSRRSVRSYKERKLTLVEKKYLQDIASTVPKGGHTYSIRTTGICMVEDNKLIEEISEYTYEYMKALKKKLSSTGIKLVKIFNSSFRSNIENTIERINIILEAKNKSLNMVTYNSPSLIILHCDKNNPISRENLTILEYQLMLGAEALKLGTCFLGWVSFAMQPYRIKKNHQLKLIYEKLKIPKDRKIAGVFSIGVPRVTYRKSKSRDKVEFAEF